MFDGIYNDGWVRRVFDVRWLSWLGTYSYFMYLYHFAITRTADHWLWLLGHQIPAWPLFALQIAVIIAAAAASYRHIEAPLLRQKSRVAYSGAPARDATLVKIESRSA